MEQSELLAKLATLQAQIPKVQGSGGALAALSDLMEQLSIYEQPYTYPFDSNTVAPAGIAVGATVNGQVLIDSSAPFLLQATTYHAALAGAAQTDATRVLPNLLIRLSDATGGVYYTAGFVPVASIFGTGQLPFYWQVPMIMRAKMALQIEIQSFEAVSVPRLFLSFIGKKLYDKSPAL